MHRPRLSTLWPAAAVWAIATTTLVVSVAGAGYVPFSTDTWVRWDAKHYLDIAQHGFTLVRCPPTEGTWCGNAGWFPGYPWLLRAIHTLGPSLYPTAVGISWLLSLGTIVLLWTTFLERKLEAASVAALVYAAFAPGQVYLYAIFPLSLLAAATLAHLWLLTRGRWTAAGLAGAVAALAYPIGVVVVPVAATWLLFVRREARWRERLLRAGVVCGVTLAGLALLPLVALIQVGHWNAYLLVQAKFDHSLRDPLAPAYSAARALVRGEVAAPQLQTLLVTFALASVMSELALRRFRAPDSDLLLMLWAGAAWLFPYLQSGVSVYRSDAALIPLAPLLRRLPRPLLFPIVAAAIALIYPMTHLFLRRQLI